MATTTPNYGLKKPDATDPFGDFRTDYNNNMDIIDANLGGGGGSGHTIVDENDQTMPARTYLKFAGDVAVTDDSGNDETVVTVTGGGGSATLAGLSDVNLTTPSDGQVLTYDGNSGEWVNANASGGGDSVSWNQIQTSGTKIAEIDINGVTTDVYAPSGGGGGALNYSLTEQVVGTWINSKPVYQKTFYSTSALSAYVAITHGIANLGLVIKTECVIRASNLSNQIPILTDQYNAEVVITPTKIEIYLNNDFVSVCNGGYIVTLQYTKTTD